eukprot:m.72047 g.72047  ORF g.72047 m.72047 type:complete len:136 (+) comp14239_c0_seq1:61-468(+)
MSEGNDALPDAGTFVLPPDARMEVNHAMTPFLLSDLEKDAKRLADEISLMTGSLRSNLHAITTISTQYIEAHRLAVNNLADRIDESIELTLQLHNQCDVIAESMVKVKAVVAQIARIKGMLDALEHAILNPPNTT